MNFNLIMLIAFLFSDMFQYVSSFAWRYASRPTTFSTHVKMLSQNISFANSNKIKSDKEEKIQHLQQFLSRVPNMTFFRVGIFTVALGLSIKGLERLQIIRPFNFKNLYQNGITIIPLLVSIYYDFVKEFSKATMTTVGKLTFAIEKAEITSSRSKNFIPRPNIAQKIYDALTYESLEDDCYTIVYGPKGIGKTELVDHTAIGRKGVVKVKVSSANKKEEVVQSITKKLIGDTNIHDWNIESLIEAVKKCAIIPTIIFDIERGDDNTVVGDQVVVAVKSLSKDLAPYCRCIVVLSEATAILKFGKDRREKFIYVDEMEREEAKELLKLKSKLTEAQMSYVFETIGTSPLDLIKLSKEVSDTYSVKDYVADVLREVKVGLRAFRHKPILKALRRNLNGVHLDYFKDQVDGGIDLSDPVAVGIAMKTHDAIVYRKELDMYMLMSTAHRTVLKTSDIFAE